MSPPAGSTPWHAYDVPTIWTLIVDQDTEALWKQVTGWKNTTDLTSLHLFNLTTYRTQLAEAWPPERSPAAQAYLAELDKLIASVQETFERASANHKAMKSVALAAGEAKYKLKPLYDEYLSNQQKLDTYRQQVEAYNADTTGMPQPPPASSVPAGRQEQLNSQARSLMSGIGGEISLAAATIRPPLPYKPPPLKYQPPKEDSNQGFAGPVLVPPVVPPVTPTPAPNRPTANRRAASVAPPSSPTPGIGQGPILGGTPTAPPTVSPGALTPGLPGPVPTGPSSPGMPLGGLIGSTPPHGVRGLTPKATMPGTGLIGEAPYSIKGGVSSVAGRAGLRPMAPGGVIGGEPGGVARPGSARSVSRVSPPGGLIGQQPGGAKGSVGQPSESERAGPYGQPGRAGRRRGNDEALPGWDPDNPWETEEGVAPVVLPPEEPGPHDPGPAIGQGR